MQHHIAQKAAEALAMYLMEGGPSPEEGIFSYIAGVRERYEKWFGEPLEPNVQGVIEALLEKGVVQIRTTVRDWMISYVQEADLPRNSSTVLAKAAHKNFKLPRRMFMICLEEAEKVLGV